ncbi:unnamed protein product [Symbiodinium sp. CCMP2592]|nr:unnamed protein product [Symbiodinium sp. CCMP2592]
MSLDEARRHALGHRLEMVFFCLSGASFMLLLPNVSAHHPPWNGCYQRLGDGGQGLQRLLAAAGHCARKDFSGLWCLQQTPKSQMKPPQLDFKAIV